jgi:hypothetical protein
MYVETFMLSTSVRFVDVCIEKRQATGRRPPQSPTAPKAGKLATKDPVDTG